MENTTNFKGKTVNVAGEFVRAGMPAPNFLLSKGDLSSFCLADAKGARLLLNIFPSLDTPVCAISVRKFNMLASQLENTKVLCISRDLPFAQKRFCASEGIENVIALSDFHYASTFGSDYGVAMTDGPLCGLFARAVVVIDENGKILYSKMNSEIGEEPDYSEALKVLSK